MGDTQPQKSRGQKGDALITLPKILPWTPLSLPRPPLLPAPSLSPGRAPAPSRTRPTPAPCRAPLHPAQRL